MLLNFKINESFHNYKWSFSEEPTTINIQIPKWTFLANVFHSTGRFPWSQLNSMLRNTNVRRNYANIKPGGLQIISNMAQYMQLQSSRLWLSYQNRSNKFSERMRSLASKDNMLAPSASNEGSRRSTITEKACTRTFSLLKTPTALSHSHIRHYSDTMLNGRVNTVSRREIGTLAQTS